MQDITEHLRGLMDATKSIEILENHDVMSDFTQDVNEGDTELKDLKNMEDLHLLTPIRRRKGALQFLKGLYEKMGKKDTGVYKDMNLWNITKYVPHILKIDFKNSPKAIKIFEPILKAVDGLYDYSDEQIKRGNEIFGKSASVDKSNALTAVTHDELNKWLMSEDENDFTVLSLMLWGNDIAMSIKDDNKVIVKELGKLSKLYEDFEISGSKGGRDMMMISGTSKHYLKELKKYQKTLIKKIEAENK